jgi:multimeric flavodoxin WrbA
VTAKRLLVVYHSQSGATESLVKALFAGATCEADVVVTVKRAVDAGSADLYGCDGLVLAAPENSGYLAGGMKDFLDRSFYPYQGGRLLSAALVISAGNDGRNAERELRRILTGMPVKLVAESLVVRGEPGADDLAACRELGATLAAGLAMGIF